MGDSTPGARSAPGSREPATAPSRLDAVATLTDQNRARRSAHVDWRLRRMRHDAYFDLPIAAAQPRPRAYADPFPELSGRAPEIAAAELDVDVLGGAIQHHGCLLVRGLFAPTQVAQLLDDLERAFVARDAADNGATKDETAPWYVPFEPGPPAEPLWTDRVWAKHLGGMLVADSPNALFNVIDALDGARVPQVVSEYLGEPLALAANKCVLRRVTPDTRASWHQDGAFLGHDVRTVDVWVALSQCGAGTDAPGLEIVPRRLERVFETADPETGVQYSVNRAQLAEALDGLEPQLPTFAPGDAMLFDHVFLHTTASRPDFTRERYALESWLFTPSTFPSGYVPLAL